MNQFFSQELAKIASISVAALIVGWLFGEAILFFALALSYLLLTHVWHLSQAMQWLEKSSEDAAPPEGHGLWADVFDSMFDMQKANSAERQRLKNNIEYFERSFTAMPDAVIILDSDWKIDWCNRASNVLMGIQSPRDHGQYLLNLMRHPNFVSYINGRDFDDSYFLHSPRNPSIELEVRLSRFGNNEHLLFARDVTKVRQVDQMRRDFTDNVSHELKTPLTVITGYLETILDQKKLIDPKLHRAIDQMHGQGERMKSLINDIISLSKLESVPLAVDETPINMRDMAEILRDEALQLSGESRVIDLSIDDDWLVTGSRSEIFSALSNLVFNAVKYTPNDAKISLSWQKTNLGASFSVRDAGPGIAQEHLSRLTERFYRVDNSRNSATGGTGLGLAIVKHIMQRHGGDIVVSSILGVGSNFVCHFPNARLMNSVDSIKK